LASDFQVDACGQDQGFGVRQFAGQGYGAFAVGEVPGFGERVGDELAYLADVGAGGLGVAV
jgi:hypothetical protein